MNNEINGEKGWGDVIGVQGERGLSRKEYVQYKFIIAMKAKDEVAKAALSSLKAKFTEFEKTNIVENISESDSIRVIGKAVTQRKDSAEIYRKAGRLDLAEREEAEASILKEFLPRELEDEQLFKILIKMLAEFPEGTNRNKFVGQTMGNFNKLWAGQADSKRVSQMINQILENKIQKNENTNTISRY